MVLLRFARMFGQQTAPLRRNTTKERIILHRSATTTATGAILHEPQRISFGLAGVIGTVIVGLLIGAVISKSIANFLEENELFVPSDDDDDDD